MSKSFDLSQGMQHLSANASTMHGRQHKYMY